jgi:hypothetical protein
MDYSSAGGVAPSALARVPLNRQHALMARTGPPAMSAIRSLTGVDRTWRRQPNSTEIDPKPTSAVGRARISKTQSLDAANIATLAQPDFLLLD